MPLPLRLILAVIFPPLAIIDLGWDKVLITLLLWIFTGIGGPFAALYFALDGKAYDRWRDANYPLHRSGTSTEKQKRPSSDRSYHPYYDARDYIELADGDVLEVVDTEAEERRRRLER